MWRDPLRGTFSDGGERRRKFDRDFGEGAVRLVRDTGKPFAQVTGDLGVTRTAPIGLITKSDVSTLSANPEIRGGFLVTL